MMTMMKMIMLVTRPPRQQSLWFLLQVKNRPPILTQSLEPAFRLILELKGFKAWVKDVFWAYE